MTNETSLQFHGGTRNKLPTGWQTMPLGEVADVLDGKRVPVNAKERETRVGSVPYYGATGQVGWIDDYLFDEELILLGEDGAPFLESAKPKAYIIRGKSWVNNHAHVLRARNGIPTTYIKHYLDVVDYHGFVTGTTRLKLTQGAMRQIPVPIAPPDQQKRIAAEIEKQFSRLDEAVANLKRVKANLKRYKAAVLKAAVEGKLTEGWRKAHPDVEPASELLKRILAERRAKWDGKGKYKEPAPPDTRGLPLLPVRWTWASADQLSLKITDGEHLSPKTLEVGVPLLSAKDVRENGVIFAEAKYVAREDADRFRNRCDPAQGDILIVSRGATIGRTCRVDTDVVFCLMGSVILIKPLSFVDTGFLLTALKSSSSHRLLRGISGSTAQQAIYIRDIRSIPIPLPPFEEQTQVFSVIEAAISDANGIDAAIDANFRRAERLRRSILSRAFCGGVAPANGALDRSEGLESQIYAN